MFGGYAVTFNFLAEGSYRTLSSAISQGRGAMMVLLPVTGEFTSDTPSLLTLGSGGLGTKALQIYYDSGSWYVYAGATQLGTFTDTMVSTGNWFYFGVDFKIDAASGWCNVYFDGVAQLTYAGQTNQGSADFDTVCVGPDTSGQNWSSNMHIDSFYFDESTGEGAAACPPMSIFSIVSANGNGNYSDFVGSDGNSVNNYLLVDDSLTTTLSNTMTDYVEGVASGDQDSYATTGPVGDFNVMTEASTVLALRHCATALEESGATEQYRPFFRYSSTDDTGTLVDLGTSVDMYEERFLTKPGGGAWDYDSIDGMEIGVESV